MTTYAIEDNVAPMPRYRGRPPSDELMTMRDLLVGQSFLIADEGRAQHARMISKRVAPGRKFTVRKVPGEGWRVWRTE